MNKFVLCLLATVILSQKAMAENNKKKIYVQAVSENRRVESKIYEEINSDLLIGKRREQLEISAGNREFIHKRQDLISEFNGYVEKRNFKLATVTADRLEKEFSYKVERTWLHEGTAESVNIKEIFAKYQEKYKWLVANGQNEDAAKLDKEFYSSYKMHLYSTKSKPETASVQDIKITE